MCRECLALYVVGMRCLLGSGRWVCSVYRVCIVRLDVLTVRSIRSELRQFLRQFRSSRNAQDMPTPIGRLEVVAAGARGGAAPPRPRHLLHRRALPGVLGPGLWSRHEVRCCIISVHILYEYVNSLYLWPFDCAMTVHCLHSRAPVRGNLGDCRIIGRQTLPVLRPSLPASSSAPIHSRVSSHHLMSDGVGHFQASPAHLCVA